MSTVKELREARSFAGLSMKQAAENSGTPYRTCDCRCWMMKRRATTALQE